jgi:hypothetical protein
MGACVLAPATVAGDPEGGVASSFVDVVLVRFIIPGAAGPAEDGAGASEGAGFAVEGVDGGCCVAVEVVSVVKVAVIAGAITGAEAGAAVPRFKARYERYEGANPLLPFTFAFVFASVSDPADGGGVNPAVQISMRSWVVSSGRFCSMSRPYRARHPSVFIR